MNKQQIKARFFGAHIGCKATIKDKERVYELVGLDYGFGNIEAVCLYSDERGVEVHRVLLDECRLVLRPLSSITDMEAAECAKIMGYKDFADEMRIKYTKAALQAMLTLRIEAGRHWHCADYLRSINICLPFMGLYPIAEGWAILEKIPENEPQTKKKEEI